MGVRIRVSKRPSEVSCANSRASSAIEGKERDARMCFTTRGAFAAVPESEI